MIRLKISKNSNESIKLQAVAKIDHFGFGTFLCDILPAEIECDEFSKDVLMNSYYKSGLQGLEVWSDNRIAWDSPDHNIIMLIKDISVAAEAKDWLRKIKTK